MATTRTIIEVEPDTRRQLKVLAAMRGQTMKQLVADLARQAVDREPGVTGSLTYTQTPRPADRVNESR